MNILIVGLGSIGRRHARVIRRLRPDAFLFALRSGRGGGSEEGVNDIMDLRDAPADLDLAVIATPTDRHRTDALAVLPRCRFLFVEKPLALSTDDGAALAMDVERAGIGSYVGCHLRFHPCLQWLRDSMPTVRPDIRGVEAVCHSWLPDWYPTLDYRQSYRSTAARSGGVHLELIHELDYVTWMFGMPIRKTLALHRSPQLAIDAFSTARYELTYGDFPATIDLSYAERGKSVRRVDIAFDDDRWIVDLLTFRIQRKDGHILFQSSASLESVYEAQMRHVLACVEGKEQSLHSVREALTILALALP